MSNVEIIPVKYGKSKIGECMVFMGSESDRKIPIDFMVYILKTGDKLILVDAGCDDLEGFALEEFIGPVKALENHGYSPENITDVIITHAHHDHIAGAKYFKNARIYIQKDEYADGKSYLTENKNIITFDDEIEVAKGVKAVKIGGHSIGSSVVEIESEGELFVIVGDECYKRACIDNEIPTGASINPPKSLEFIQKYKKSKLLFCHDE